MKPKRLKPSEVNAVFQFIIDHPHDPFSERDVDAATALAAYEAACSSQINVSGTALEEVSILENIHASADAVIAAQQARILALETAQAQAFNAQLIAFEGTVYDYNRAGVVAFKLPNAAPTMLEAAKLTFQRLADERQPVWIAVSRAVTAQADGSEGVTE